MSKRYAVVNKEGRVVNCILWDGFSPWSPPEDHVAVRHDECSIDDHWDHEKKELHKICRMNECPHESHASERVHTSHVLPEHME